MSEMKGTPGPSKDLRIETDKDMLTILRIQNKWSFTDDTVSEES